MMKKRKKRILTGLLIWTLAAVWIVGCTPSSGSKNTGSETQTAQTGPAADRQTAKSSSANKDSGQGSTEKITVFTDDCGRKVKVPARITSTVASGSLAQIYLYALAPDTLEAVNGAWTADAKQYVDEKYQNLKQIGSFFGQHDLNYEEIASINPQIVIDVGENKPSMKSDLDDITKKTGIPAVHIDADFNTTGDAYRKLGKLMNREKKAEELAAFCDSAYQKAKSAAEKAKKNGGLKKVLYCTQEDGMNVIAADSYHSQVLDLLTDNLARLINPSSQGSGNAVDMEQMLNWNPEIIIFSPDSYYSYAGSDPNWKMLKAIKNGTYYETPSGPYNWMGSPPSSNRVMGMLWLGKLLYPGQADYDLEKLTKQYYRLFYHCSLTTDRYNRLVENSIGKEEKK